MYICTSVYIYIYMYEYVLHKRLYEKCKVPYLWVVACEAATFAAAMHVKKAIFICQVYEMLLYICMHVYVDM